MKTLLIVLAIAICGCIYHAQWRHQAWLEKREAQEAAAQAFLQAQKERHAADDLRLQRQLDAVKRISDQRRADIKAAQVEDEWKAKRAELWKTLLPK